MLESAINMTYEPDNVTSWLKFEISEMEMKE